MTKTYKIDELIDEYNHLKQCETLLKEIWDYGGPYFTSRHLPEKLVQQLQRHFEFDDSE